MKHALPSLLLASCLAFGTPVTAQTGTSRGTTFWITYLENLDLGGNGNPYLYLVVSSEVATQGELQVPATGDAFPFTVGAMQSTVVFVPSLYLYPIGAETYYANGLRLVSDDPVTVHAYHHRLYFSDATMVLPIEQLGDDHFVIAQIDEALTAPSELGVMATADGTEVEVTPSVITASLRPAGVPFIVMLDAGEVFQLQAFSDMTGSRVRSLDPAKPVAVFAGSKYGNEGCMGATDHFYTQMMPVANWGGQFALVPYLDRGGDNFKFLAIEDGTTIDFSNGTSFTLDSGQYITQHVNVPLIAQSEDVFAVAQLNESESCNAPGTGDGCIAFVPPLDHMERLALFQSITGPGMPGGGWTPDHTLNIVTTSQTGTVDLDLDGSAIGSLFAPMPSAPAWYYARMNISEGPHILQGPTRFQAQTSGFGSYNSYTYFTGFEEEEIGTGLRPDPGSAAFASCIVASGPFVLPLQGIGAARVDIIDARGMVVRTQAVRSLQLEVDASTLSPGFYTLLVHNAMGQIVMRQRLVVVR